MVADFSVAMATAHEKSGRRDERGEEPFTYLGSGGSLQERGWLAFFLFRLWLDKCKLPSEKTSGSEIARWWRRLVSGEDGLQRTESLKK